MSCYNKLEPCFDNQKIRILSKSCLTYEHKKIYASLYLQFTDFLLFSSFLTGDDWLLFSSFLTGDEWHTPIITFKLHSKHVGV